MEFTDPFQCLISRGIYVSSNLMLLVSAIDYLFYFLYVHLEQRFHVIVA